MKIKKIGKLAVVVAASTASIYILIPLIIISINTLVINEETNN